MNIDFDDRDYPNRHPPRETHSFFIQRVHTFILSQNFNQPIQRFSINHSSPYTDPVEVDEWLNFTEQHGVQNLQLILFITVVISSPVLFSYKTLVHLYLSDITVEVDENVSVDLPSLEILRLYLVKFQHITQLAEFLNGTPGLKDLEIDNVWFTRDDESEGNFTRLPNLLKASLTNTRVPLDVISNVHSLQLLIKDEALETPVIPEFQNLTHFVFGSCRFTNGWNYLMKVLKHCPKLQNLSIEKIEHDGVRGLWSCPLRVSECIALHLKTCGLSDYSGTEVEFVFAKYIMQNARILQDLTISTGGNRDIQDKNEMLTKLLSCRRLSSACKLSFD